MKDTLNNDGHRYELALSGGKALKYTVNKLG